MQRKFTFFPTIILLALMQLAAIQSLHAQAALGTEDDGFLVQILTPASIAQELVHGYNGLSCTWVGAAFGDTMLRADVCASVVWAQGDSLGCTPLQDMTGKIALLRRGICNFSLKVYNAQQAGAVGAIVLNHYANAADGPCSAFNPDGLIFGGMAFGDSAAAVHIPSIYLYRQTGEEIDGALAAGQEVNVCFSLPRFYDATGPYHYATPVTQVDSLLDLSVHYINRDATVQEDVAFKAEITEPGGNVVTLNTTFDTLNPGSVRVVPFPAYLPAAVVGEFNVLFTNNKYTQSRDSLHYKFVHTPYTFATDNFVLDPGGVGVSNANFIAGDFTRQEGALCVTGPNGGFATYATFGIANIDSVFVADLPLGSTANDILVFLYDGDADENGAIDITTGFDDMQQIGYGSYTMTGNEQDGVLVDAQLGDFLNGGPVELKPSHPYYVSLYYNGLEAGIGRDIRFSNTLKEWNYQSFPTSPVAAGSATGLTFYSGWEGLQVINRLQLQGYEPVTIGVKPTPLAASQVSISPNPATDVVRVDMKLNAPSDMVTLTLFDWQGRAVSTQVTRNLQEGQMSLNVKSLPAGTYTLWVRTAEGTTVRKLSVNH